MSETKPEDTEGWQKVERILGEPVFEEFSDNTLKIRRNLMIIATLVLAYKLNSLTIDPESALFGVKFINVTNSVIDQTFFWLVTYHLIHFSWNCTTHIQAWRIRITGTRLAHTTGGGWATEEGDYPDNPRQSSLYCWWKQEARQIGHIGKDAEELRKKSDTWQEILESLPDSIAKQNIVNNVLQTISGVQRSSSNLESKIKQLEETFSSNRIPVSLRRFDRWFLLFQWNQLAKWIAFEFGLPIVLGLWAAFETFPYHIVLFS